MKRILNGWTIGCLLFIAILSTVCFVWPVTSFIIGAIFATFIIWLSWTNNPSEQDDEDEDILDADTMG